MGQSAKLVSLATSVPPHVLHQSDVASAARRGFAGRYDDFERMARVFKSSGIRQRHAVRPIDWYLSPLGWPERTSAYLEGACQLFVDAATRALDAAELDAAEVDTIVSISSTGVATPSLEARVAGRMGFRADVERVPVFGLGCAGGVSGFSIASRLACSRPGSIVLLVAVEVCTLAFRLDELTKANMVATALFGDGAAACVLKAYDGGGAAVEMSGQHTWPDTLDIMGWRIDPQGFGVIFDRAIPPFAQRTLHRRSPASWPAADWLSKMSIASPVILAARRSSPLSNARSRSSRVLSTTNARSSRTMATCRRRPCYSSWTVSFARACLRAHC